ncbi:hypothetical protein AB0K80_32715 [Streptomyces sp. NPDC052682]|uniref:hypothetical protein n=1 Tax=Streptomyces sp. NPDC052682 TaxID=3154954 RepID=UPI003419DEE3
MTRCAPESRIPGDAPRAEDADRARAVHGPGREPAGVQAWLRREIGDLRERAAAFVAGRGERPAADDVVPDVLKDLRDHWLGHCQVLHDSRNGRALPAAEQTFPGLPPALARLRKEHRVVTRLRSDIADRLERLEAGDPCGLLAELDLLIGRLERHFAYQEAALVTVLDTLGSAPARQGSPPPG